MAEEAQDLDTLFDDLGEADEPQAEAEAETPEAEAAEPVAEPAEEVEPEAVQQENADTEADAAIDAVEADAPAAPSEEPPAEPEAAAPEVETEPFSFTVNGRQFEVEGATVARTGDEDFIVMPRDQWQRVVQPRLRDESVLAAERKDYERRLAELNPEINPEVVQARTILEKFSELAKAEPEAAIEWFEGIRSNLPLLVEQARVRGLEAERSQRVEQEQTQAEQRQQQALEEQKQGYLVDQVLGVLQQAEIADKLTPQQLQEVTAELWGLNSVLFVPDPNREGEIAFDSERFGRYLSRFVSPYLTPSVSRAQAVEQQNAAKLEAGKKKPPPTVPAKGVPGKVEEFTEPSDWSDWEKDFDRVSI